MTHTTDYTKVTKEQLTKEFVRDLVDEQNDWASPSEGKYFAIAVDLLLDGEEAHVQVEIDEAEYFAHFGYDLEALSTDEKQNLLDRSEVQVEDFIDGTDGFEDMIDSLHSYIHDTIKAHGNPETIYIK